MPTPRRSPYLKASLSGAVGDGLTDDTAALSTWITGLPAIYPNGFDIQVDKRYYVPGGFSIPSNCTFHGTCGGALLGDPSYITAVTPIPTTKITAHGVFAGSAVAYSSAIAAGSTSFTVANSFTAGQYVMLRNYPTDTGGGNTDAYTIDVNGNRYYPNGSLIGDAGKIDAANKRQFRRIEPARIRTATSSGFTLYAPVAYDYTYTQGLEFAPYNPVKNILFDDVSLQDIFFDGWMADRIRWRGGLLYRSTFGIGRSMGCNAIDVELDAENTDNCIGFGRSCVDFRITGNVRGGNISSDNSLIRVDQAAGFRIDVSGSSHKGGLYLFLGDTNYAEDPGDASGRAYPDVPLRNGTITLNDRGENMAAFLTCNRFAAGVETITLNITTMGNPAGQAVYLKGCDGVIAHINTPNAGLRVEGTTNTMLSGRWASFYAPGPGAGTPSGSGNGSISDPIGVASAVVNSIQRSTYATY